MKTTVQSSYGVGEFEKSARDLRSAAFFCNPLVNCIYRVARRLKASLQHLNGCNWSNGCHTASVTSEGINDRVPTSDPSCGTRKNYLVFRRQQLKKRVIELQGFSRGKSHFVDRKGAERRRILQTSNVRFHIFQKLKRQFSDRLKRCAQAANRLMSALKPLLRVVLALNTRNVQCNDNGSGRRNRADPCRGAVTVHRSTANFSAFDPNRAHRSSVHFLDQVSHGIAREAHYGSRILGSTRCRFQQAVVTP